MQSNHSIREIWSIGLTVGGVVFVCMWLNCESCCWLFHRSLYALVKEIMQSVSQIYLPHEKWFAIVAHPSAYLPSYLLQHVTWANWASVWRHNKRLGVNLSNLFIIFVLVPEHLMMAYPVHFIVLWGEPPQYVQACSIILECVRLIYFHTLGIIVPR